MNHLTQDHRRGDPKLYDKDVEVVYIRVYCCTIMHRSWMTTLDY